MEINISLTKEKNNQKLKTEIYQAECLLKLCGIFLHISCLLSLQDAQGTKIKQQNYYKGNIHNIKGIEIIICVCIETRDKTSEIRK